MALRLAVKISLISAIIFLNSVILLRIPLIAEAATKVSLSQITTDGSQQSTPVIFKNKAIWTDWKNSAKTDLDIFQYDLNTKKESPLIVKPGQQWAVGLNEKYVIYNQYFADDPKSYDIRAYNLQTGKELVITDDLGSQEASDFEGSTIIYIDGGACGKLFSYDLNSKVRRLITDTACAPARIWNNIIVWANAAPNGTNIYGFDRNTSRQFDIVADDGFQEVPDINGDSVVYLDRRSGAYGDYNAIKVKNLKTGVTKTLYESSTDALNNPAISNKYAVWSQSSVQHVGGVMAANLKTGEVFEVQSQGPHQNSHTAPSIWENIAVWQAWRIGNGDIYGAAFR